MPLICGVDHLSSRFEYSSGTVVVDLEHSSVIVHDDDQRMLAAQRLAGFDHLAQSLQSLTALVRGVSDAPPTAAKTHFAVDAMIRRVRQHIARLIDACVSDSDGDAPSKSRSDSSERNGDVLLRMFMQSQMFQKYQDDQLGAASTASKTDDTIGHSTLPPATESSSPHERVLHPRVCDWQEAARVLFRIAVTGASAASEESDSNNAIESSARPESDDASASASPEPSDRDQDPESASVLSVRVVNRTSSSHSRTFVLFLSLARVNERLLRYSSLDDARARQCDRRRVDAATATWSRIAAVHRARQSSSSRSSSA